MEKLCEDCGQVPEWPPGFKLCEACRHDKLANEQTNCLYCNAPGSKLEIPGGYCDGCQELTDYGPDEYE